MVKMFRDCHNISFPLPQVKQSLVITIRNCTYAWLYNLRIEKQEISRKPCKPFSGHYRLFWSLQISFPQQFPTIQKYTVCIAYMQYPHILPYAVTTSSTQSKNIFIILSTPTSKKILTKNKFMQHQKLFSSTGIYMFKINNRNSRTR